MAFFQEPERQPFLRVPAVTAGLIAAIVLAHIARALAPPAISQDILVDFAFYPIRYSHTYLAAHGLDPGPLWERALPFVSYMFLHGNFTHLLINCVWLLPFGAIVARRFGASAFLLFFFVCGIAGAGVHLATNWGSVDPVVGASAAISGLMAAGFRIIAPISAPDLQSFSAAVSGRLLLERPLAPLFAPRVVVWTVIWTLINVSAGLTGLGGGPGPHVIAWQAHIGGYLAGLILAGPFDAFGRRLRSAISPPTA